MKTYLGRQHHSTSLLFSKSKLPQSAGVFRRFGWSVCPHVSEGIPGQIDLRFCSECSGLSNHLQSGCDLIQGLLNAVEFHLSSVRKLLDALWCALKMMRYVSKDLATALAQQEHAQPANEHSQAA